MLNIESKNRPINYHKGTHLNAFLFTDYNTETLLNLFFLLDLTFSFLFKDSDLLKQEIFFALPTYLDYRLHICKLTAKLC